MADTLELWLIRHGETDWNRERRIQGDTDAPLNNLGLRQAAALAKRIGHESFDAIYSSDLQRASRTAQIVFPNADIIQDKRLREINLGHYEGRVWHEVPEDEQAQVMVWFLGPYDQKVPGGESSDDLQARALDWLTSLPKTGRIIAFSHGGFIANTLQLFTGRPKARSYNQPGGWGFRLHNASISKLLISEIFTTLEVINDYTHLEGLES